MKTMHSESDRRSIEERMRRLKPTAKALWGKMDAPRMLTHLTDAMRMATGELHVPAKKLPTRFPPIKQLFIYVLPMFRSLPTAKELVSRPPIAWNGEVEALSDQFARFAALDRAHPWPDHPAFGPMSARAWGVIAYKHCDHHLRQFGV